MALYYFILKTTRQRVPDRDGEEFPDEASARRHAIKVACELMRNRELDSRLWRIEVRDENLQPCFDILFASIDQTIDHLGPQWRQSIETVSRRAAALTDAILEMRATLADVRSTLTRASAFLLP